MFILLCMFFKRRFKCIKLQEFNLENTCIPL